MLDSSSDTFSELITYNQTIEEDYDLEFDINLYGIIVNYDYFKFIKKKFFDEYITINKCNIIMNERFNHFICEDNTIIPKNNDSSTYTEGLKIEEEYDSLINSNITYLYEIKIHLIKNLNFHQWN